MNGLSNEERRAFAARFARNLIRARRVAGVSQEELGFLSSIHRTEVGMLERGQRIPKLDTTMKIAGALHVPITDLVDGLTWNSPALPRGSFEPSPETSSEPHR
jgi:transcriptional regulator with XRE-family HTH domain